MGIVSGYHWCTSRSNINNLSSISVQHVIKNKRDFFMSCICEIHHTESRAQDVNLGLSGYFCEQLTHWFYQKVLENVRMQDVKLIEEMLLDKVNHIKKEIASFLTKKKGMVRYDFSIFLLYDDLFWYVCEGNHKLFVLNKRFTRKNMRNLSGECGFVENGFEIKEGRIQKGVGILMATENFIHNMSQDDILQSLGENFKNKEKRLQKRVSELVQSGCSQTVDEDMNAIFLQMT